jgi:hypothetical protein
MRRALVNHYMSAESLLPWFPPGPGTAMGKHDHRDIVHPHIRADGDGGCAR